MNSISAELTTGEIVTLPKDCDCPDGTHDGPHWLYADAEWRALNESKYLAPLNCIAGGVRYRYTTKHTVEALCHHYAEAEMARLHQKRLQMEMRNIERLIVEAQP